LDKIRLHGENSELRDEVTDLARKYGIVTPYTAYLILEDETQHNVPMAARSFQGFERDREARTEAAQVWNGFKGERAGESAVADARSSEALKAADAPAPAGAAAKLAFSRRYGLAGTAGGGASGAMSAAPPADTSQNRLAKYAQQTQFVAGKNFFQNDKQWIDSAVQKHPNAKRIRIQFGSPEYFDLIAKNAKALPWLALGQNVQFVLDNTLYDIYE
jgi:Ca-activated chloride channel family protein